MEFYNCRTAKRQRKNSNGMVETGHYDPCVLWNRLNNRWHMSVKTAEMDNLFFLLYTADTPGMSNTDYWIVCWIFTLIGFLKFFYLFIFFLVLCSRLSWLLVRVWAQVQTFFCDIVYDAVQMPPMPSVYSSELVNLIRAMLNKTATKRPSVSRVLRDPYIKRNIALFLEETRTRFFLLLCR